MSTDDRNSDSDVLAHEADAAALRARLARDPAGPPGAGSGLRRPLLLGVALLGASLAVGLVAFLIARDSAPVTAAQAQQQETVVPADQPTPHCCDPTAAAQDPWEVLDAAPDDVTWQLFQGVALPVSSEHGPSTVDGAVHAGFSRTPTGALLAAAQIGARRLITPDPAGLRQVAEQQLVDGPGKQVHLGMLDGLVDNEAPLSGYAQYVGFRQHTWSPDLAVVALATRSSSGHLQVSTDSLRWVDGDWRLDLPPDGLQRPQLVADLAGYVPWSGVS